MTISNGGAIVGISYVIMMIITILLLYRQEQRPYVYCKTVTSVLFLVAGWMAYTEGNAGVSAGYDSPEERFKVLLFLGGGLVFCLGGDILLALAHEIDNQLTQPKFTLGVGSSRLYSIFTPHSSCQTVFSVLSSPAGWPGSRPGLPAQSHSSADQTVPGKAPSAGAAGSGSPGTVRSTSRH